MTDETIFATALEKADTAERGAYLDSACAGNAEQRKRLDSLLAAHDKAGSFLARPAVATPEPESAATRAFEPTPDPDGDHTRTHDGPVTTDTNDALAFLAPPRRPDSLGRIGHYEVLEVLGQGGFGIVYRAFDEVLQRVVAVKVLAPTMAATSPARKRFTREARSSASVRHDNVVQVYAVEEQLPPYLVMEFIPGETLQQRLDRTGPLEVPEVLRIGRQIAAGLAAAHEMGLIHRDIKPSNILIDSGPQQRVKLTDFGLARAADDASISQSGVVAGTPMYMAPEQAKGDSLDHRADLFSLGSVLYVMCTGHPPFRASGTLAVLKRVADDTPRPIREVIPEVPEWLCRVIEKLHAKNPDERFQSAKEVADLLADCEAQLLTHATVKDTSRIPEGRPAPRRSRRRWKWAAAAVVVLLCSTLWVYPAAWLQMNNLGEVQLVPEPGVRSIMLTRDGARVTGWLDMNTSHRIMLPPGAYQVRVATESAHKVDHWEVNKTHLFSSSTSVHDGQSLELGLYRGERVTVRPVLSDAPPVPSPKPPVPVPNEDGWVSLFNGKDLTGWEGAGAAETWLVDNGLLVGRWNAELLRTRRADFGNFHLRSEVQYDGPESCDLYFRAQSEQDHGVIGYSTDLMALPGGLMVNGRDTATGLKEVGGRPQVAPRVWFTVEVIAEGERLRITVNDRLVAEDWNSQFRQGFIGFQCLGGGQIRFRKIEIKELPATPQTPEERARIEAAKLSGEWVVRRGKADEQPLPGDSAGAKLFLMDGKFTLPIRADDGYSWALTGPYTIDAAKKQLAFKFNHEPLDTPPVLCTYSVDGDKLVLDFPEPKDGEGGTELFASAFGDRRLASQAHLKALGIAILNYADKHNEALPPAAITDPKDKVGKPLLSWRVALLPYLNQESLYKEFKLDEPWDSEHNKKLIEKMPKVYAIPGAAAPPGHTHYRVFVGPGTAFEPRPAGAKGLRLIDLDDGASNTILVAEAADPVVWTRPDDLSYDPKKPLPKLGVNPDGAHVLAGDGTVWRLSPQATEKDIRGAIVHNDGAGISDPQFRRVSSRGPALHLELERREAAAGPRPILLKSFDPVKDKPVPPGRTGAEKAVTVENGVWRIENALDSSVSGNFYVLFGTVLDGIPEDGVIICRAKVKLQPKDKNAWGDLRLGDASPSFHGYDWPKHLAEYRGEIAEWTEKEVRYPVAVFRKKNPPSIPVYVGLHANGVLWVKDLELLYLPATHQPAPPLAVAPFDGAKAKELQEAWAKHLGVPVEMTNSIGMKLRLIPPGKFVMGMPVSEPILYGNETQHDVEITKPFHLGTFEVTQEQYEKVMGKNPSLFSPAGSRKEKVKGLDTKTFPVEDVEWDEAVEFCKKMSELPEEVKAGRKYRLPTEAEWEYACRAGTKTRFAFGNDLSLDQANFDGRFLNQGQQPKEWLGRPTAVGSYKPNSWGLFDMHGNVWEWCQDWYQPDYYSKSPKQDPPGPNIGDASRKVRRGGDFGFFGLHARSGARFPYQSDKNSTGLRVVMVIEEKPKPAVAPPDPAVVQALRDAVAAKERTRDLIKIRVEAGKDAPLTLIAAEVDLIEARIRLAAAEKTSVVARLEELVTQRQEERRIIAVLVAAGVAAADELNQADARLADAKARLAMARSIAPPGNAPAPRPKP